MQIYINMKSGNPVTIVKKEGKFATVQRIDCDKQLYSPLSALVTVEQFTADGGELCNTHMRLIEQMRGK